MNEIWKVVPGYEGLYMVSNHGRIKSVEHMVYNPALLRDGCYRRVPEKILNGNKSRGYHTVCLTNDGKKNVHRIHYLVARAFIGEAPTEKHQVTHIDGNRDNNHVDNLMWVTPKEYMQHALETGNKKPLTEEQRRQKSETMKKRLKDNPDVVKRSAEAMKQKWADPEYKARVSQKISEGWQKRVAEIEANKPPVELYHVPDLPGEVWKDVVGYEGHYAVSNMGRVKSLHRDLPHKTYGTWHINEHLMKPNLAGPEGSQYYSVALHVGKKSKNVKVHRMVAEAFIPRIEGKDVVNHKDCNKLNNKAENLEWCTNLENVRHAIENNLMDWSKIKRRSVVNVETGEWFRTIQDAEDSYNVAHGAIGHAVRNGGKSCGFHWKYAEGQV